MNAGQTSLCEFRSRIRCCNAPASTWYSECTDRVRRNHGGALEEGMVICVESLIAKNGSASLKLATLILIAAMWSAQLDCFPWDHLI